MNPLCRHRFVLCVASVFVAMSVRAGNAWGGDVERSTSHVTGIVLFVKEDGNVSGPENFAVTVNNHDSRVLCVKVEKVDVNFGNVSNSLGLNPGYYGYRHTELVLNGKDGLCNFTRTLNTAVWEIVQKIFNVQNASGPYSSGTGQYLNPRREDVWNFLSQQCRGRDSFSGVIKPITTNFNVDVIGKPPRYEYPSTNVTVGFNCVHKPKPPTLGSPMRGAKPQLPKGNALPVQRKLP